MEESAYLKELSVKPLGTRLWGYWKLAGPGYLQSAMTLGGGSVASSVLMGSLLGYDLLWVQPVAIILGIAVLAAVAKQTTTTEEKPYTAFWNRLHPALAILWAVSAMVATVLWHIPQYSLTANGVIELALGAGIDLNSGAGRWGIGVVVLVCASAMVYLYSIGARGLKLYENGVKVLVWAIVVAFAVVAFSTGVDWGRLFFGITGISFLQNYVFSGAGVPGEVVVPIVGGIAAAVGINMVFLYPYSLLNKKWGPDHKELAYFDLASGMAVPFVIATGLMMIAVANSIGPEPGQVGESARDIRGIIPVLEQTMPGWMAQLLLGVGMTAIGFSTIITHMLAAGFIGCELFNVDYRGRAKWFFALVPAVGIVGVTIPFPWWAGVTASSLAACLMPAAVVGFILLLNMRSYMKDETPAGTARIAWNAILIVAVLVLTVAGIQGLRKNLATLQQQLAPTEAEAREAAPADETAVVRIERSHAAMGAEFSFVVYADADDDPAALQAAMEEAFAAIDSLEGRISTWQPQSNTSLINRTAHLEPVRADLDVWRLLRKAEVLYEATGGAFDVTVGPLVEAYGIYTGAPAVPDAGALADALGRTGFDKLKLDAEAMTVAFEVPGMRLDFGGLGKGLALDRAARVLRDGGVTSALLNGGTSTILAIGAPPAKTAWTVEVGSSYTGREQGVAQVALRDAALSTSEAYRELPEPGEAAHSHIFDPRTGEPVDGWLSATAVAPTGLESDALSTVFYILDEAGTRQYCAANPETGAVLLALADGEAAATVINLDGVTVLDDERTET